MLRRIFQYLFGVVLMAFGIVLIKRAEIGISPLSAVPAALSNITPYTMGTMVACYQSMCALLIVILMKRITVKNVLIFVLAFVFGYIIDLFMLFIEFGELSFAAKCLLSFVGIISTALGIVAIVGADLMLPSPDALLRQISAQINKPLGNVKIVGDVSWVAVTAIIELIFLGRIVSVGVGTVASMLLTGKFVNIFKKLMPFLEMEPTKIQ